MFFFFTVQKYIYLFSNKIIFSLINFFFPMHGTYAICMKCERDEANYSRKCRFSHFIAFALREPTWTLSCPCLACTLFTANTAASPAVSG